MPREQTQWFMKESIDEKNHIHAKQSCTYYSIVNVNKNNYPFLSSYEKEQTWTLTRTLSNNRQRYQTSIENIHLTVPTNEITSTHKRVNYENIPIKKTLTNNNSNLLKQKYISSTSLQPIPIKINSTNQKEQKNSSVKTVIYENSKPKCDNIEKKTRPFSKPMRVIHSNGEFVVRI